MANCDECGIDEEGLSIADAMNALRSYPRRYAEAVAGMDEESIRQRPSPDVWSVIEYLVHVREVLEILAMAVPLVLDEPGVAFPDIDVEAAATSRPAWVLDPQLALNGIAGACAQFLGFAEESAEAWSRPFTLGTTPHEAGWIPRHAAHEGAHHLRDIASVRKAVS